MTSAPRVSIGLPVFNGENYIEATINSILRQSFTSFELVISDNASSDQTQRICETYVAKDPRIRYYRNDTNIGPAKNFNLVVELSSGEYFKWAAHDDLLAPTFLQKCLAVLDRDPSVALSYPAARIVDENGEFVMDYEVRLKTDSPSAHVRFRDLLRGHSCFEVFGLIRASVLRRTPLMGNYGHGDGVLLARLGLMGRFQEIDEYLFFPRRHSSQSAYVYGAYDNLLPDYHRYTVWFDPTKKGRVIFPHWRIAYEFCESVASYGALRPHERGICYYCVCVWLLRFRWCLLKDIMKAFKQFVIG